MRKKPVDHAKNVRGNTKHSQVSTEEGAAGLWEAISHCPDLSSQSKFDTLAMNMQLAMSDAKERTRAKTKEVRG